MPTHERKNQSLLTNENEVAAAPLVVWILAMAMMFTVAVIYIFVTPYTNLIADTVVELGAPKQPVLWIQRCYAWAFAGTFLVPLIWALTWSYKREDDTGYV